MTAPGPAVARPRQLRLFIAIPLPEEIKREIAAAQAKLRLTLPDCQIGWTEPEQMHLTLKFLGNVREVRVEILRRNVGAACRACAAVRLRAAGVGFFPERGEPRVVWAGIGDEAGRLAALHEAIETATRDFTAEERRGEFAGHVTLGRPRRMKRTESETLRKAAAAMARRVFGEWTADAVEIMRSELTPDGARHESLASIRLGERA